VILQSWNKGVWNAALLRWRFRGPRFDLIWPCLYKIRLVGFQDIQSGKMVFVARACKNHCILHESCPVKTQHFYPNAKSSFLTNSTVSFMLVQLFQPMRNRFAAGFRNFYYKTALGLFTLWILILCVCLQKLPCFSTIFHRWVRHFTYIRVSNVAKNMDKVALRRIWIKNLKFRIIKIRMGCQCVRYLYDGKNLNRAAQNLHLGRMRPTDWTQVL